MKMIIMKEVDPDPRNSRHSFTTQDNVGRGRDGSGKGGEEQGPAPLVEFSLEGMVEAM